MPRPYSPKWDLTTIPDDAFKSEHARRNGLKGGRPRVMHLCATCERMLTAREIRYACPNHEAPTKAA